MLDHDDIKRNFYHSLGTIEILGETYSAAEALKLLDPELFRAAFMEYAEECEAIAREESVR